MLSPDTDQGRILIRPCQVAPEAQAYALAYLEKLRSSRGGSMWLPRMV